MKIAIVHDWLVGGGAERVIQELHELYPDAPIYTSYCTPEWRQKLNDKVVTGYLQYWPFGSLRKFLPVLRRFWFRHLDLSAYDLVISSAGNGEAKDITVRPGTTHICYCHSPTHFYWRHYDDYMKHPGFGVFNPLARLGLKLFIGPLRKWDYAAAQKPDYFIANSTHIQADIKKYYGREATVIHPPVDIERFRSTANGQRPTRHGFVTIGRLKAYKRVDLIIQACNKLQLPLTVVGRGPELGALKKLAGPTITFDSMADDQTVVSYMQTAEAFIFAAHEDFGITPVEAMAAGTPIIAYQAGGALDYVKTGQTGLFFESQTVSSLIKALQHFQKTTFNQATIRSAAQQFSSQHFRAEFSRLVTAREQPKKP
jgi:glycosyltransferase involved in cell wall biosynthesis